MSPKNARSNRRRREWEKNKRRGASPCYLWLLVDNAGVVGVLRRDVLHRFVRVPTEGGLDGDGCLLAGGVGGDGCLLVSGLGGNDGLNWGGG